jgi:hypothetical protein
MPNIYLIFLFFFILFLFLKHINREKYHNKYDKDYFPYSYTYPYYNKYRYSNYYNHPYYNLNRFQTQYYPYKYPQFDD